MSALKGAFAVLLLTVACAGPTPAATQPSAPTSTPLSSVQAIPTSVRSAGNAQAPGAPGSNGGIVVPGTSTSASPNEVEDAFLTNIDDLIAEAADLAVTPCQDLTMVTQDNPNLVPSVRGFASVLKRVGTTQSALDTDAVRAGLADLDHSMGELEGALSLCGIK